MYSPIPDGQSYDFIPPQGQRLVYVYKHEYAIWADLRDEGEIVHLHKYNFVTLDWEDAVK